MRCPCCKNDLIVTHQDRYESLDEHISNSRPSVKSGYQCVNPYCVANSLGATWISDGDLFIDSPHGVKNSVVYDILKITSVTGNYYALDTWGSKYETMKERKEKGKRSLSVGKWKVNFIPVYHQGENGEWKKKRLAYTTEIWKRTSDGCYYGVVPFHRMLAFSLNQFSRNMRRSLEGDEGAAESCYGVISCVNPFGKPEKRLYSRVTSLIVRVRYPNFCRSLVKRMKK